MDINEIKDLIITIDKTNLGYVKLDNGNFYLEVSKNGLIDNTISDRLDIANTNNVVNIDTKSNIDVENKIPSEDLYIVKAPLMGTFYESSSPDSPPFIKIGDKVDKSTTLCIVEAMKLMNELTSEVCGEIVEILVSNEELVEYNQPLFKIKLV